MNRKPFVLVVLDGFGEAAPSPDNAISQANTPNFHRFLKDYPHTLISASGLDVGLPEGQMGNSEVGHTNLGAGRIVYQDLPRVSKAIHDGDFFKNPVLLKAIESGKAIHVMGLLSPGGVHSHEEHIQAMVNMAIQQGAQKIYVHAFLDGRDTPPKSAEPSLAAIDALLRASHHGYVASVVGRYYAMDRDQRWDRVQQAYDLLVHGKAEFRAEDALSALLMAYDRNETDEFVKPTCICPAGTAPVQIQDGDSIIFMNFRGDRARQLSHAFLDEQFTHFDRGALLRLAHFVSLAEYEKGLGAEVAYPPLSLTNVIGEVLSQHHKTQLRIAETEKYAHVTFFFNGGNEAPFPGEERILVPSPKVATYDLKPEMSANELTQKLIEAIQSQRFDVIISNYANADMVGHTGDLRATVKAIETLDHCLGQVVSAAQKVGGEVLITADHGNAEKMFDESTDQAHTAHTNFPVPLIYIGRPASVVIQDGRLSDVAPSLLTLMNIPQPPEMTGRIIFKLKE